MASAKQQHGEIISGIIVAMALASVAKGA